MWKNIFTILFVICFFEPIISDSWITKGPASYSGRGGFIAEIFPINSRLKNDAPICFFYENIFIDYEKEDYDPQKRFKLIWSGDLINDTAPNGALVSSNGYLITLDEHALLGSEHSIVLYDKDGDLIKDYFLSDIVPEKDIYEMFTTTSSIHWRYNAKFYFCNPNGNSLFNPSYFYVVLESGMVIEIKLNDGKNNYGELKQFPFLDSLNSQSYVNEIAIVNETSLEYSSITELLECIESK